ncbi:MAG: hypothetical protein ACREUN_08305 [Burkholderiales bacterium]
MKLAVAGAFTALVLGSAVVGDVGKQAVGTVLGFAVADAHAGQCGSGGGGKGWGWGKWKKKGRH